MVMAAPGVACAGGFVSGGAGYEYRLPWLGDAVGVGGMAELMFMSGHPPHPMLMASVSVHPVAGAFVGASAGAAHVHTKTDAGTRMSTEGVVRLSAGYDLHAGSYMLTPHLNLDLGRTSGRAISAGVCVGRMF
jgi:hypothetical protein